MSDKITLEEIVGYLPYGVGIDPLWRSTSFAGGFSYKVLELDVFERFQLEDIKPILRPLSDLTKEIEVNGEKFVPIDLNAFKNSKENLIDFINGFSHYKSVKYGIIQKLYSWHFDIHNLINRNLAIDINTIKL